MERSRCCSCHVCGQVAFGKDGVLCLPCLLGTAMLRCHVKVDYSRDKDGKQKAGIDWVASGNAQKKNGQTAESVLGSGGIKSMGKPYETRSYLRWEDPVLGISGEGRASPSCPVVR